MFTCFNQFHHRKNGYFAILNEKTAQIFKEAN